MDIKPVNYFNNNKRPEPQVEKTIDVNCYGIQNLIDLQKTFKFKLINISTGSVFQDIKSSKLKITEEIVPTPKSVYSTSKRLGEILINNCHEINKRSCNLRVSWVYGPPIILKKFDAKNSILILDKNSKDKIFRATKNIPNVKCTDIGHFSAYDILKFKKIIFTETSVKELEKRYN